MLKLKRNWRWIVMSAGVMAFTSCFNKDYDLSDIDTNVRIPMNDLVIPLNMSDITLESVLDLDEDDPDERIKRVNGVYAVVEEGDFSSSNVNINPIRIARFKDVTSSTKITVTNRYSDRTIPDKEVVVTDYILTDRRLLYCDVTSEPVELTFEANGVDDAIESIDAIETEPFEVNVSVKFHELSEFVKTYDLEDLVVHLPKGLKLKFDLGEYNPETGDVTFYDKLVLDEGAAMNFTFLVEGVDVKAAGATFENHKFSFNTVCVATGHLSIYRHNLMEVINAHKLLDVDGIGYTLTANMSKDMVVKTFSGNVKYQVDDINIDAVSLDNLPDYLLQDGTSIGVANPQIYLSINNPIQQGVKLNAQLELQPSPANAAGQVFTAGIEADAVENVFCYAPQKPASYYPGWEKAEYKEFANLGEILKSKDAKGERIPSSIDINVSAGVDQFLDHFNLGNYGKVHGSYTFFAPLQMTEGSYLAYSDTINGWSDKDLDKLTITSLDITAKVSSDLPADAVCDIYPIDESGKKLAGVTVEGADIPANAKNHDFHAVVRGTIKKIDGIILKAHVKAHDGEPLSPTMTVKLTDTKVKVSGYYDDEL